MTDTTATETLATMSLTSRDLLGRMTPAERVAGRYLRAPDGHDAGGDDAGGGEPDDTGADDSGGAGDDAAGAGDDKAADDTNVNDKAADKSLMDDADDKAGEPDPATLPPEKYELTPPEGMQIDDTLLAEVDPIFREAGLSNDTANKLMPAAAKLAAALQSQQNDAFQAMKTDWAKEAKADPDIGKGNWKETEGLVAKALDNFGAPKDSPFRKLLNETGLGNHPEMIRMFRRIGAQLGEGGELARSDAGAAAKPPREAVMYPDDVPKQESV